MTQEIYKKQFSVAKILTEAWKIFKENFQLILIITLIVYIPINIALAFVLIDDTWQSVFNFYRISQILELLIGVISTMAIAYAIKKKIEGKSITIKEALKKSISRWGPAVSTNIILGLFLFGLTLLLIIPGIIFYVYWFFAIFVVILKNKSGKKALDYSKQVVKGRWWTVAGYILIFSFFAFLSIIINEILYWILPEGYLFNENLIFSILSYTIIDIIQSFFIVVLTIFFINFDATKKIKTAK